MRKLLFAVASLCLAATAASAQLTFNAGDTYSHHIGVQINPLLRQILSFGNAEATNNPFLVNYSFRQNEKRLELTTGLGYVYELDEDIDGFKSDFSALDLRVGVAKKILLGSRFEAGFGLDLLLNGEYRQTINVQAFGGGGGFVDSTITTTKGSDLLYGGGPRFTLDYYITNTLKIGTEASLYFRTGGSSLNIQTENYQTDFSGNLVYNSTTEERDDKLTRVNFQVPVVVFLAFVF